MNSLLSDPWIAARIDEAVAPYVGVLPAEEVAWMREQLAETLATDEHAARILRGAHPREVDQSGEVGCDPGEVDDPAAADASKRGRAG